MFKKVAHSLFEHALIIDCNIYLTGKGSGEQVDVIPFVNTWPYERQFNDIYLSTCPFCGEDNVLTNMKKFDFKRAQEGIKTVLIMPCCHGRLTILEADEDYFWTDMRLRKD